jgi:hypothetical protein
MTAYRDYLGDPFQHVERAKEFYETFLGIKTQ